MSQKLRFDSVTIDSATRTAIRAIVDCDAVTIRNADTTNSCTLFDDATAGGSRTLAAGEEVTWRRPDKYGGHWRVRDVIVWARASSGTGPIEVDYLL